jgi:hypothetical protein
MKSIHAPTTLKVIVCLCWVIALAMIKNSDAGDYFIYQDLKGNLVLSNTAPPGGSKIIKRETLSEVSDQQIAESRVRDDRLGFDNRVATLEKSIGELSGDLRAQGEVIDSLQQGYSDRNIAVGVTQGPAIVARLPRRHLSPRFRNDFPNGPPRGTVPSPLQQRPGARGRS